MADIIISGVLLAAGAAGLILTAAAKFGFLALVSGVWLGWSVNRFRRRVKSEPKNLAGRIVIAVVVTGIGLSTPPLIMDSSRAWQLPFQRAYMNIYQNTRYPDFFPEPEEVIERHGAYRMSYLPSLMQGTGHITVGFTAGSDYAQQVKEQFEGKAVAEFPLLAFTDEGVYYRQYVSRDGEENIQRNILADDYVSPVPEGTNLYHDQVFGKFFSDKAVVYMLSDNRDFNHPHSSAVIVDTETGAVEFIKYG